MPSLGAFKWDEIDYISKIYIKYRRRSENWAELVISAGARERGGSAYLLFHISNPERYKFDFLDPIAMKEQFKLYISDIEKNERKLMEEELQKYKTLAVERSVRYIENRNDDFM
ncbi:MAG: hypothetical protein LBR90_00010 [Elusimicrobiota bacterium]|nr:hypothetical protein [Elusimicrobiota bacterium]